MNTLTYGPCGLIDLDRVETRAREYFREKCPDYRVTEDKRGGRP